MKQVKKLLCGVLMVCMIVAGINIAPQKVQAATASGNDGEIHWEIKGDTLTLSAVKGTKGRMNNYSWDKKAPWNQYIAWEEKKPAVKNVFITNSVTKLGSFAFQSTYLEKMTISGSVDTIPHDFCVLGEINTLVLNNEIEKLDNKQSVCFLSIVRNVFLPKSLKNIPYYEFSSIGDGNVCGLQKVYGYSNSSASKYVDTCNEYDEISKTSSLPDGNMFCISNGTPDNKIKFVALDKSSSLSKAKATSSLSLNKGKSQTIKVTLPTGFTKVTKYTGSPADVKVTFKSSNPKVATVSSSGKVTGKKKGTAKITVTMQIKDGAKKTVTTKVTVK